MAGSSRRLQVARLHAPRRAHAQRHVGLLARRATQLAVVGGDLILGAELRRVAHEAIRRPARAQPRGRLVRAPHRRCAQLGLQQRLGERRARAAGHPVRLLAQHCLGAPTAAHARFGGSLHKIGRAQPSTRARCVQHVTGGHHIHVGDHITRPVKDALCRVALQDEVGADPQQRVEGCRPFDFVPCGLARCSQVDCLGRTHLLGCRGVGTHIHGNKLPAARAARAAASYSVGSVQVCSTVLPQVA